MNWSDAGSFCTEAGYSSLATITDDATEAFVEDLATPVLSSFSTPLHLWLGLNDLDAEGTYVWSSGVSSSYTHWNSTNPDGGAENCVVMAREDFLWHDVYCSLDWWPVCETR